MTVHFEERSLWRSTTLNTDIFKDRPLKSSAIFKTVQFKDRQFQRSSTLKSVDFQDCPFSRPSSFQTVYFKDRPISSLWSVDFRPYSWYWDLELCQKQLACARSTILISTIINLIAGARTSESFDFISTYRRTVVVTIGAFIFKNDCCTTSTVCQTITNYLSLAWDTSRTVTSKKTYYLRIPQLQWFA